MRSDYIQPQGAPYAWNLHGDAKLAEAVKAYFASRGTAATPEQLAQIRAYLTYYVDAPSWQDQDGQTLPALRQDAREIADVAQLRAWISRALDIGIDPF